MFLLLVRKPEKDIAASGVLEALGILSEETVGLLFHFHGDLQGFHFAEISQQAIPNLQFRRENGFQFIEIKVEKDRCTDDVGCVSDQPIPFDPQVT